MYVTIHLKYPSFFSDFKRNFNFFDRWHAISEFIKTGSVGAEKDRQTDRYNKHDKADSRFSQFCERA